MEPLASKAVNGLIFLVIVELLASMAVNGLIF